MSAPGGSPGDPAAERRSPLSTGSQGATSTRQPRRGATRQAADETPPERIYAANEGESAGSPGAVHLRRPGCCKSLCEPTLRSAVRGSTPLEPPTSIWLPVLQSDKIRRRSRSRAAPDSFGVSRGHLTTSGAGYLTPRKTEDARTGHRPGLSTKVDWRRSE